MVSQYWGDNSNEHWILKIQEGYHTHAEFLDEQRTGWNHLRGIQLPPNALTVTVLNLSLFFVGKEGLRVIKMEE